MWTRTLSASLLVVAGLGAGTLAREQTKPPSKPDSPFAVFLLAKEAVNEEIDLQTVTDELANRVAKKKTWLKVVDKRDEADIVVEVLAHLVTEEEHRRLDLRVDTSGDIKVYEHKNWVYWISDRHRIEIRVTLPSGAQKMLTGEDGRERGGSLAGAASNVAEQLEDLCKKNYWDLVT
ncbi:MAG: hypothetical protein BMS9Abin37_0605 [Acidobacteriota bacterium]|nr:MAG: hypothetical protein BMS9Abin37_0605 [Acidobacteriota bacterium]